ncbi:MYXO-CTERM sorting domain-containing protein [Nannocystaceae bacterium ST9]
MVLIPSLEAEAIQPPDHLRGRDTLELEAPRVLRSARTGSWDAPPTGLRSRALARLEAELGPVWARFDRDTGALDTLIPHGLIVAHASASSEHAQRFARELFERHAELLAPGIDPADLVLVADVEDRQGRTLGFAQTFQGKPVIGGQISLRFAHDRLSLVRSQLVPHPTLAARSASVDAERAIAGARTWIADDFASGRVEQTSADIASPIQILPLIHASGAIELIEVRMIEVSLASPIGRWQVFVDAASGDPVARRSTLMWANLQFEVQQRSTVGPRVGFPARGVSVEIAGVPQFTDQAGGFTVAAANSAAEFGAHGQLVTVSNDAGPDAALITTASPASSVLWGDGEDEQLDAQLNTYVHALLVKDRVRSIAPDFDYLDQQLQVTTNIADVCNAFSDGDSLNFFLSGGGCQNSGRIADVVYHEFGHSVHTQSLIPGVGVFDGALSEGIADYLAATIVDDPKMGIGFFFDASPIRDLDPEGFEWHWPEDKGEVHDEGRIIGGTLWDLREALRAEQGALGIAKTDHIWFEGIRRAVDIPSMYLEALAANDDDGNLANGTPDACVINDAFAAHGLFEPPLGVTQLNTQVLPDFALALELEVGDAFPDCPSSVQPSVRWRVRAPVGAPDNPAQTLAMQVDAQGRWHATIPAQAEFSVVQYQVDLDWGNGTVGVRPDNPADPWYEHFIGEPTLIWCSGFESEGETGGWTIDGFQVGNPVGASGDPDGPFAGLAVAGNTLAQPGTYSPGTSATLVADPVAVGDWQHVRLQYRRWLNVEDGFFDQARITANGTPVWTNVASFDEFSTLHHRDREWRFHDVEIGEQVVDGMVQIGFTLSSDFGLEFGGWNIDEVCIVGHGALAGECGNALIEAGEQCDDGNEQDGDGCSAACIVEGDEETGTETGTDTGDESGETGDATLWVPDGRGCGCASEPDSPRGSGVLGLALIGLLGLVRRRARRA